MASSMVTCGRRRADGDFPPRWRVVEPLLGRCGRREEGVVARCRLRRLCSCERVAWRAGRIRIGWRGSPGLVGATRFRWNGRLWLRGLLRLRPRAVGVSLRGLRRLSHHDRFGWRRLSHHCRLRRGLRPADYRFRHRSALLLRIARRHFDARHAFPGRLNRRRRRLEVRS